MEGFLGETIIKNLNGTPFSGFTSSDWAKYWIEHWGSFDGSHHKEFALDQVMRILHGTKIIVKLAKWENGYIEYRPVLDKPSEEYVTFIEKYELCGDEWPMGTPP